ncbi:MAG: pyruvate kinase [Candidatus Njordarchaeia archaeon]
MTHRKTKILATLGPATDNVEKIIELIKSGVDGFRFNYSHGDIPYFEELTEKIRDAEDKLGKNIPIMGDLQGPTVRLGNIEKKNLKEGEEVEIRVLQESPKGSKILPLPNEEMFKIIEKEDFFLIDDGKIIIKIVEKGDYYAKGIVVQSGEVRSHVTVAVKGKEPDIPSLSERDIEFVGLTVRKKLNYIALSFVRNVRDLEQLEKVIKSKGGEGIEIVSKIETKSAIKNLETIVNKSDMILIARGDLGMHYSLEKIPILQKYIAETCLKHGKPSILATQLLESMINNPIPTRSEVSDIHTGVMEGVSAMMLSGETAIGRYPVEAVKWLRRTIEEAERNYTAPRFTGTNESIYDKFALGTILLAEEMSGIILAYTKEGQTAKRISRYRPNVPVYVLTTNRQVARKINLLYGLTPIIVDTDNINEAIEKGKHILLEEKKIEKGAILIKTSGLRRLTTDRLEVEIIK